MDYTVLPRISCPFDLKNLSIGELLTLCDEIRDEMIHVVSKNGGHLASNLGVVELTVALHTVFNAPEDSFVFDVGHQCYTHKLLTGRFSEFSTLRKKDGIAGFPRPDESKYDLFVAGHSSQSLSAAVGLARAKKMNGDKSKVIVIVGDGAFAGGMIYEAINGIDASLDNLIVVLNDNKMSISKSVGSLSRYLLRLRTDEGYNRTKKKVQIILEKFPIIGRSVAKYLMRIKTYFRHAFFDGDFFEALGFNYVGALDGHNLVDLIEIFVNLKTVSSPTLVHVITSKGRGYEKAEQNPGAYHGIGSFNIETGEPIKSGQESFSNVFGHIICEAGYGDNRICAVTAAMKYATGLNYFSKSFPERFFDVGIAEQHAVTFCCGLARGGFKPVFAVYSSFLQRAYDQIIHDVVLGNMDVMISVDRAGIVGEDGETHNGIFDVAMLSGNGKFTVVSPSNFNELRYWTDRLLSETGPRAIRYPRGGEDARISEYECSKSEFDTVGIGSDILIVTYGREFAEVVSAREILKSNGISADILKLNVISPLPDGAVDFSERYSRILFVEEGIKYGGIAERFSVALQSKGNRSLYRVIAVNDPIVKHSSVKQAFEILNLDAESVAEKAKELLIEKEN